jgi:antitoxin FitA
MPVTLSIKNAPDHVVKRLRERAQRNHRSLQGELLAIIEEAARDRPAANPSEVLAEIRKLELKTAQEAVSIIRGDRDGRR